MARDKVHLMERVKQLETYQLRVGTHLVLLWEITLPAFKLNQNTKSNEEQLSNVSTAKVVLKC
jgi:hypothetical protein